MLECNRCKRIFGQDTDMNRALADNQGWRSVEINEIVLDGSYEGEVTWNEELCPDCIVALGHWLAGKE